VAVLLELARILSSKPYQHPIWLVAFDLEEFGTIGSQALTRSIKENGPKPLWMASLEIVGYRNSAPGTQRYPVPFRWFYRDRSDFLLLLSNPGAHTLMGQIARSLEMTSVMTRRFTMPFRNKLVLPSHYSDHVPSGI
jgi:Zn-dependent M28 family amino/carboxypeptidase